MYIYICILLICFLRQLHMDTNVSSLLLDCWKRFDSVVRLTFLFYLFMLLVRNYLIFQKMFSEDLPL